MAIITGKVFKYRLTIEGEIGGAPDENHVRALVMQQTHQSLLLGSAAVTCRVDVEEKSMGEFTAIRILGD